MDIVCNIDNQYVKYCTVMLTSLFENNKGEDIHIHILTDNLSDESKKILNDAAESYGQKLSVYYIDPKQIENYAVKPGYISIATYYRCFISSLLPETIKKAIYLDCDLIVAKSIKDFWNIDISNYAVGAVEDMWSDRGHTQRLGYPDGDSYFNAGVLIVNLDYWRKNGIEKQLADYIVKNAEILTYNDQDALNGVLHDKKIFIPYRWNMQAGFLRKHLKLRNESIPALKKEIPHYAVIHYTGSRKPWHDDCTHPLKSEYYKYLDMTIYKGERPPFDLKIKLKKLNYAISSFLGLKNNYIKIKAK